MKYRKYVNIVIIVVVIFNWIRMFPSYSSGRLLAAGLRTLRQFTVLSNLFEAYACIVWLYKKDELIKYIGAVSLSLTFIVVLLFLGPVFGFKYMYLGSNLWFHLIIPIIAVLEIFIFNKRIISINDNLLALIPMIIYGIGYIGNVLINGIRTSNSINDWYGFFTWGYLAAAFIFVIIVLGTYFIGFIIKRINNKLITRKDKR